MGPNKQWLINLNDHLKQILYMYRHEDGYDSDCFLFLGFFFCDISVCPYSKLVFRALLKYTEILIKLGL